MRANAILQLKFGHLREQIHSRRLACVFSVVAAVIAGGQLQLTKIGRCLGRQIRPKHAIKCVDRLLGNAKLFTEVVLFYAALCRELVPPREQPIVLIDWTDIGKHWAALVATLASDGRGVVIYSQVHPRKRENNPRIEAQFLRGLKAVLPPDCIPILVCDAGFRGPWLSKVAGFGWDFVVRVRGRVKVCQAGKTQWESVRSFRERAASKATRHGAYLLARYRPVECELVTIRKRRRGTKRRLPKVGRRNKRNIRSAWEPWVLATSLTSASANEVVRLYALRMRIEETFRDAKCPRLGWGLDQVRALTLARVSVMVLLAALAHYVALLAGAAAERLRLQRAFQANTETRRRVLSLATLGGLVLCHRSDLLSTVRIRDFLFPVLSYPL